MAGALGSGGGYTSTVTGSGGGGDMANIMPWRGGVPASARGDGSVSGSAGGSAAQADFEMPAYQPYQPQTYEDPNLALMAGTGADLMDPGSKYYQDLLNQMQTDIGKSAAAGERASSLRGAWSGFGSGASPEAMMTSADIGQAGLEAQGAAAGELALTAPTLGAEMMGSTFAPTQSQFALTEGSQQYGAGLGEQARQFGVGVGLEQQAIASQEAQFGASQSQQAQQWEDEFNLQQDEFAARYGSGGYGAPTSGYGGGGLATAAV